MELWLNLTDPGPPPTDLPIVWTPWINDDGPPAGEPTESDDPPLTSKDAAPAAHPGAERAAAQGCPRLRLWDRDPPACGGLRGVVKERALVYQQAAIRDPHIWTAATAADPGRPMRQPSATPIQRVLAHFAQPAYSRQQGRDREQLLKLVLEPPGGRSPLETWEETSDFTANGLLRLLFLYGTKTWAPDPNDPATTEPIIGCGLQQVAVQQLLGFKYFGDEAARHPDAPAHDEVYWSENHQLLFATAEYLAGQLLPDERFQPTAWAQAGNGPWQPHTDPAWAMTADQRMSSSYPRLVRWLDHRLMFGLAEWTSPVYFDYDIAALLNLIDFCDDNAVADRAAMALDVVLLELARFAGRGHGPGTAGRAYPSHKYSGWGASVCDTLQILFGQWPVEQRAEEVLETWRVEYKAVARQAARDAVRAQAQQAALQAMVNAGAPPDVNAVGAAGDDAVAAWDAANPPGWDDVPRAVPPDGHYIWSTADAIGAHFLATSHRYCVPDVIFGYAEPDAASCRFERSRVSITFEEGASRYGIGYTGQANILDWWARAAFGAPQTIVGSRDVAQAWGVEGVDPFASIAGMFSLPPPALEAGAVVLAVESLGSCLTTANLCVWREGDIALSSVQKFRVGQVGRQAQIWQANLGPYITVWSTYPRAEPAEQDNDGGGLNWWGGNACQPRVVQHDDALICIHDSTLLSYTNLTYGHRSHAWFPVQMFHEALEVRRPDPDDDDNVTITDLLGGGSRQEPFGLNADRGGAWWFGRWNDDYVGLFSAKDSTELLRTGRWADREILCEDRVNVFICQVGSRTRFGSFADFVRACSTARVHVGKGVYQPSNPFVDIQCSYDLPQGKRLSINLGDRYPAWDGRDFSDEDFCRWETPWSRVLWNQRKYTLAAPNPAGGAWSLTHDCTQRTRTGDGL